MYFNETSPEWYDLFIHKCRKMLIFESIRIKQEKEKYIDYIQDELKYWYEEERKEDVMIIERINCLKEKVKNYYSQKKSGLE